MSYLDKTGLEYFWSKIKTLLSNKADKTAATQSAAGLMSAADKKKLDGVASGANAYSHPTSSGNKHIPSGGSSGQILRWASDGTAAWGADNDTKVTAVGNHYTPAADSSAQLSVDASSTTAATWGSTDLVTGVNIQRDAKGHVTGVTVDSIQMPSVDSALSSSSTNPVQNKVVTNALSEKVAKAGDTMTGNLTIQKASSPTVALKSTNQAITGNVMVDTYGRVAIQNVDSSNTGNYATMLLGKYNSGDDAMVQLKTYNNGTVNKQYYMYHTGHRPYTYGTSDLTAGSSSLETGDMYLVYE